MSNIKVDELGNNYWTITVMAGPMKGANRQTVGNVGGSSKLEQKRKVIKK